MSEEPKSVDPKPESVAEKDGLINVSTAMVSAKVIKFIQLLTAKLVSDKKSYTENDRSLIESVIRSTLNYYKKEIDQIGSKELKIKVSEIVNSLKTKEMEKRLSKLAEKMDANTPKGGQFVIDDVELKMYAIGYEGDKELTHLGVFIVDTVIDKQGQKYFGFYIKNHLGFNFRAVLPASDWGDNSKKLSSKIKGMVGDQFQFEPALFSQITLASESIVSEKQKKSYVDFGWIIPEEGNEFEEYIASPDFSITKDGYKKMTDKILNLDEDKTIQKLQLRQPDSEEKLLEVIKHIKEDLLTFNNIDGQAFLTGHVFISCLQSVFNELSGITNCVAAIYIANMTGEGKSACSLLFHNFYGDFDETDLYHFDSTTAYLESAGHNYKDASVVYDDLKFNSMSYQEQASAKKFVQSIQDRKGRGRLSKNKASLNSDYGLGERTEIRGAPILNGEDFISGEASAANRIMVVDISNTVKDQQKYRRCMAMKKYYSCVMSDFILWILKNNFISTIMNEFEKTNDGFAKELKGDTLRYATQASMNYLGFLLFCKYCVSKGIMDSSERKKLVQEHHDRILALLLTRRTNASEEHAGNIFLNALRSLIVSKTVSYSTKGMPDPDSDKNKPNIGFFEFGSSKRFYLNIGKALSEVSKLSVNNRMNVSDRTLGRQLNKLGYLAMLSEDGHPGIVAYQNGGSNRYWVIKKEVLFEDIKEESNAFSETTTSTITTIEAIDFEEKDDIDKLLGTT